jgi:hypothetical protein
MADAVLQYDFAVVGEKAVERAFASIEKRAVQHNARMARAFGGTSSGARVSRGSPEAAARTAASAQAREDAKLARWRQQLQNRHFQNEERLRKRAEASAIRSEQRIARESAKAQARAARESARVRQGLFGTAGRSVRGSTRAIGMAAGGMLAVGGTLAAGNAISQQVNESKMASQLANQARRPDLKGALLKQSQGVRGFTGEEALAGMGAFVDLTGDLDTARALITDLGRLSLATGSNLNDVAGAAGNFANNLKDIKDPAERARKVMEAMRALAGQGQAGAIELKDMAGGGAVIGAVASQMGGDVTTNIKKAGVLAQAARAEGGAKSADEALTGSSRFIDFMVKNAAKLEAKGVKGVVQRDAAGNITSAGDPREFLANYLEATKGDLGDAIDLFGEMGVRVVRGFAGAYRKGGKRGVYNRFDELMNTELKTGDIDRAVKSREQDADYQMLELTKSFNQAVGQELLPVLMRLIPEFKKLLPHVETGARMFASLADSLLNSPLTTIGSLVAAKLTADLAAAQIGNVIKGAITGQASGVGAGGLGLSLGAAAALTIYAMGVTNFHSKEGAVDRAGAIVRGAQSGTLSPEEAQKQMRELRETSKVDAPGMFSGLVGGIGDAMDAIGLEAGPALGKGHRGFGAEFREGSGDPAASRSIDAFEEQLRRLAESTKTAADAIGGAAPNRGNVPSAVTK